VEEQYSSPEGMLQAQGTAAYTGSLNERGEPRPFLTPQKLEAERESTEEGTAAEGKRDEIPAHLSFHDIHWSKVGKKTQV